MKWAVEWSVDGVTWNLHEEFTTKMEAMAEMKRAQIFGWDVGTTEQRPPCWRIRMVGQRVSDLSQ